MTPELKALPCKLCGSQAVPSDLWASHVCCGKEDGKCCMTSSSFDIETWNRLNMAIEASKAENARTAAEPDKVRVAAEALYTLEDRDTYVNDLGRPKPEEWSMAWQRLGEALGRTGVAAQSALPPPPRKES